MVQYILSNLSLLHFVLHFHLVFSIPTLLSLLDNVNLTKSIRRFLLHLLLLLLLLLLFLLLYLFHYFHMLYILFYVFQFLTYLYPLLLLLHLLYILLLHPLVRIYSNLVSHIYFHRKTLMVLYPNLLLVLLHLFLLLLLLLLL